MSVISEDAIALGHNSQLSPLDVPTAIWQRQSIRHFAPDPIAPSLLKQLIELTVAAPTSWNLQEPDDAVPEHAQSTR